MDEHTMQESLNAVFLKLLRLTPEGVAARFHFQIVACDPAENSCLYRIEPLSVQESNPFGTAHGGTIATLMDCGMGILCVYYNHSEPTPTVSLQLSYLRPTPLEQPLFLRCRIIKAGGTLIFSEGTLWLHDEHKPLVRASAVYLSSHSIGPADTAEIS